MKIKFFLIFVLVSICNTLCGQLYTPDASKFLPGPSDDTSVEYIKDYSQYAWGKTMRESPDWLNASTDINYQLSTYINAFSPLIGLQISKNNTPSIYMVLDYIMTYGQKTIEEAKNAFRFVLPPYARFNEQSLVSTYEEQYSKVSSYPSSFAFMGWLTALTLVEICPDKQDDVLIRGYNFGNSSIIAGYNWDSDAISARYLASALSSAFHNHSQFNNLILAARKEYREKTGIDNSIPANPSSEPYIDYEDLPDAAIYLPKPPTDESVYFAYDLNQHIVNSRKRREAEGVTARADVEYSLDYFCEIFSSQFGKEISSTKTPQIYELLRRIHPSGNAATQAPKSYYRRLRPYVKLNEISGYPSDDEGLRNTGSYPSGHASGSWLYALVLSEINPKAEEEILARAYQYGQGRVITGFHWQSDVDAGRIVASAVYSHLHACDEFMKQMSLAKQEFEGSTGTRTISVKDENENNIVYKLNGTRVEGTPTSSGIYIQGNKKVAVK